MPEAQSTARVPDSCAGPSRWPEPLRHPIPTIPVSAWVPSLSFRSVSCCGCGRERRSDPRQRSGRPTFVLLRRRTNIITDTHSPAPPPSHRFLLCRRTIFLESIGLAVSAFTTWRRAHLRHRSVAAGAQARAGRASARLTRPERHQNNALDLPSTRFCCLRDPPPRRLGHIEALRPDSTAINIVVNVAVHGHRRHRRYVLFRVATVEDRPVGPSLVGL